MRIHTGTIQAWMLIGGLGLSALASAAPSTRASLSPDAAVRRMRDLTQRLGRGAEGRGHTSVKIYTDGLGDRASHLLLKAGSVTERTRGGVTQLRTDQGAVITHATRSDGSEEVRVRASGSGFTRDEPTLHRTTRIRIGVTESQAAEVEVGRHTREARLLRETKNHAGNATLVQEIRAVSGRPTTIEHRQRGADGVVTLHTEPQPIGNNLLNPARVR